MKRISVENIADTFAKALAAGDEKGAWGVMNRALSDGLSVTEACEMVLLPALASLSRHNDTSEEPASQNDIVDCVERIIAMLQPQLTPHDTHRPRALIVAIPNEALLNPLLNIRARVLTDLLEYDGWRVSLSLTASPVPASQESTDALILIPDAGADTPGVRGVTAAIINRLPCAHTIIITGGEVEHCPIPGVLAVADEHEAHHALKELHSAGRGASAETEAIHLKVAEAFECSDVLLCILDDKHCVVTANRLARDGFGFTPGEPVTQYLDAGSRDMFGVLLMNNSGLATELVEIGFLRHGESYLADVLLVPCGAHLAMIGYPKQEEINRLTKILNNYNNEINKLNRELRELRARLSQQTSALETANAQVGAAFNEINETRTDDPLTGAFNRKYYTVNLVNEINRARRYQRSLGFLLVGIDEFDRHAQELGRAAADEILRNTVRVISQNTRRGVDWIARAGDHEFVVVLPETDMDGCLRVGEKLRALIASSDVEINGKPVRVTISVGGASYDALQDVPVSIHELTSRAGRALGRARREGPNRQSIEPVE